MPFSTTSGECSRCFKDKHRCTYCPDVTFYNSSALIEHLQSANEHARHDEVSVFHCSICNNKSFSSKTAYIHHLQQKLVHRYDLHQAVCCGKYEDVDKLIRFENMNVTGPSHKVNYNVEIEHHTGWTPLHCAAFSGYSRCLKVMLSWPECNPNVIDKQDGRTPVHVAVMRGNHECLKELLKKGGRLDIKDNDGNKPLNLVLENSKCVLTIVRYLWYLWQVPHVQDDSVPEMVEEVVKFLVESVGINNSSESTQPSADELRIQEPQYSVSTDMLPYEVLARGKDCIEAFKKVLAEGKTSASRIKLMVVGEVDAGKTSLTRSLSGQPFVEAREKTHGIETSSVSEIMDNVELNCSWQLADPCNSHVDNVIANLLSERFDPAALTKIRWLLQLSNYEVERLACLPVSPTGEEIVQSPISNFDQYPGLSAHSGSQGTQYRLMVTEEKVPIPGVSRLYPASYIAREFSKKGEAKSSLSVNIWDFAGHELYETMHHIFLNSKSLYLVVFSLLKMVKTEEECLATIHHWLNSIAVHTSRDAPIFLVGTHRAKVNGDQLKGISALLKSHFDDVFDTRIVRKSQDEYFFPVENSKSQDDEGVVGLIDAIKKETLSLEFMREELPVKWLHCEEEIIKYRQHPESKKCPSIYELKGLLDEKCEIQFTDEEFRLMLNFFHDSGLIILPDNMSDDDTKSCIRDRVILSPQYLVDVMTHIHDAPKRHAMNRQFSQELKKLKKEGKACSKLLEHAWEDIQMPMEALIELLGHFNLLYPLHGNNDLGQEPSDCEIEQSPDISFADISSSSSSSSSSSVPSSTPLSTSSTSSTSLFFPSPLSAPSSTLPFSPSDLEYIVPCLLKTKSEELLVQEWKKIFPKEPVRENVFVFDFGRFLPPALFDYLLVCMYRQNKLSKGIKPVLQRQGGIFSISNQFVFLIQLKLKHSQIRITVRCKNGESFLDFVAFLAREVEKICRRQFKFLKFIYGPPCPREVCPGACADVECVQRPCDPYSSDSRGSSSSESDRENDTNSSRDEKGQLNRRVHVIPMNTYNPPFWCQRVEIPPEDLKDWNPNVPCQFDESFDEGDGTNSSVQQCCFRVVVKALGGDDWKQLGRALKIDDSKLQNIESEERKQNERCQQALMFWKRSSGKRATIQQLKKALEKIDRVDVAEKLGNHDCHS